MLGTGTALSTVPYCARNAQLSIGQPVIAVARLPESSVLGLQFAPFATFTGGAGNEEKKIKIKCKTNWTPQRVSRQRRGEKY